MRSRRKRLWLAVVLSALIGCNGNYSSGDRVLVDKFAYDAGVGQPKRYNVVVFRFPGMPPSTPGPTENDIPKNYIKRLMGLPGQLLAVFFGQIFYYEPPAGDPPLFDDLHGDNLNGKTDPNDLWKWEFMHVNDVKSKNLFEQAGKFQIARKSPEVMLAMRRIVSDNDFPPPANDFPSPRWQPTPGGWSADKEHGFDHTGVNREDIDWIRYQHILYPWPEADQKPRKELIVDFLGYNSQVMNDDPRGPTTLQSNANWVGSLMIECQLNVAQAQGEFWLELNKSIDRFQACFDLSTGKCTLYRVALDNVKTKMGEADTRVKAPGQYILRLANFDARLTVWVDDDLPFGEGKNYDPPQVRKKGEESLTDKELLDRTAPHENDLKQPASIGSKNARLHVQQIRLWRDSYYTTGLRGPDVPNYGEWADSPAKWRQSLDDRREPPLLTMYVQPGHYLCLGDNSPASSDSREWGLVPQRLLLGRALMVYWPYDRFGPIR